MHYANVLGMPYAVVIVNCKCINRVSLLVKFRGVFAVYSLLVDAPLCSARTPKKGASRGATPALPHSLTAECQVAACQRNQVTASVRPDGGVYVHKLISPCPDQLY